MLGTVVLVPIAPQLLLISVLLIATLITALSLTQTLLATLISLEFIGMIIIIQFLRTIGIMSSGATATTVLLVILVCRAALGLVILVKIARKHSEEFYTSL